jgi:hypothetical protein
VRLPTTMAGYAFWLVCALLGSGYESSSEILAEVEQSSAAPTSGELYTAERDAKSTPLHVRVTPRALPREISGGVLVSRKS